MKKVKFWCLNILIASFLFLVLIQFGDNHKLINNLVHIERIHNMAEHLNNKYGYDVGIFDCTFFMKENYERDKGFFGFGSGRFDVPYVAAFDVDGRQVIVTDREGFISDNGQFDQLSDLITEFYVGQTGLTSLEFVEVRSSGNGNSGDRLLSDTLQRHFSDYITGENIDEFLRVALKNSGGAEMIFYFREEGDREQQIVEISEGMDRIAKPFAIKSLKYYTFIDEDSLDIQTIRVNLQSEDDGEPYTFTFGCDYLVNPHEMQTWEKRTETTFGYYGFYVLNRGYSGGFGKYADYKFELNGSEIVDMLQ